MTGVQTCALPIYLTTVVLAQVILEEVKERTASIPRQVLARLIRLGAKPASAWVDWTAPQEALARARTEAERIAQDLIARGRLTLEEALALRQEIAAAVQRAVSEAQQGLEARLHSLLGRGQKDGASPSLRALEERLMAFETYLAEPAPPTRRTVGARPSRSRKHPARRTQNRKR